jgi:hypothetical protein
MYFGSDFASLIPNYTVSIDSREGIPILPLYYPCCERRLAPSMIYITLVIILCGPI